MTPHFDSDDSEIELAVDLGPVLALRKKAPGAGPDPIWAALAAERGGADAVIVPLDGAGGGEGDALAESEAQAIKAQLAIPLILEIEPHPRMIERAALLCPVEIILAAGTRAAAAAAQDEATSWVAQSSARSLAVSILHARAIRVTLRVSPHPMEIDAARDLGFDGVELDASALGQACDPASIATALESLRQAAAGACLAGLAVSAGRDLSADRSEMLAGILDIEGLHVGHTLFAEGLVSGWEKAVRDLVAAMRLARLAALGRQR
jgi:pyridoxine 5-phosphate synthase